MIRRTLLVLLVAISLAPRGANQTRRPSYAELFDAVWQTVNDTFFDPSFGGLDWAGIIERIEVRLGHTPEVELAAALHEIGRIARSRLEALG